MKFSLAAASIVMVIAAPKAAHSRETTANGTSSLVAYRDVSLPVERRVEDLLARMTLEEKIGQMCQYVGFAKMREVTRSRQTVAANDDTNAFYPGLDVSDIEQMVRDGKIGSFQAVFTLGEANELQQLAQTSRLKIPLIIGVDAIHGDGSVRGTTVYPTPLSLASTFDPELVEKVARQTAIETRANGAQWTFSPNIDVARDARWGRVGETFGEDPFLVGLMGAAMVRGYQGADGAETDHVLACIKHLIAGSAPANGLNFSPMDVSERTLRSVFLPPYLECIKAGAGSLMAAHNELNGVPCHANHWIIEGLMRQEAGFRGFVVSDWTDIERLVSVHHVAANQKEAVYQTVMAGMDMHMHGPGFLEPLLELIKEGRIPEKRIDESTRRILRAKFQLGLFEHPVGDPSQAAKVTFSSEHQQLALEAARKAIVLLKNQAGLLPLDSTRHRRILVTGPLAETPAILGDWVLAQPDENVITPLEGLRRIAPAGCTIVPYDCGKSVMSITDQAIAQAARLAREADAVVVIVGENSIRFGDNPRTGGENIDRSDLDLPGRQLDLVRALATAGKPVVVALVNCRPLSVDWIAENISAIVEAWEPGCKGGQALAEVLFGAVNPSGRLPISFPRGVGHIQTIYNHKPSQYFQKYAIGKTGPLFEFGDGLSYTTFTYSNLRFPATVRPGQAIPVAVDITNTGKYPGDEVVLAYVNDVVSSVTTPVRELKAFSRVTLRPGETKTVPLTFGFEQLALFNVAMQHVVEPGDFDVFVGGLKGRFVVER